MPLIPPGYCQITWRATNEANGQIMNTSLGASVEGLSQDAVDSTENAFWDNEMGGLMWEGWHSIGCLVKVGTSDPSEPITYESRNQGVGEATGAPSSPQVAVLVKKTTLRGGRRGRGRMYIPGPQELWVNGGGQIDPAGLLAYQSAVTDLQEQLELLGCYPSLYILHTTAADGPPDEIVSMGVEGMVATQRRRLR